MDLNLNRRTFKALGNSKNGEVSGDTVFYYRQEGKVIWAEYSGGPILKGFLLGKIARNILDFSYQHLNQELEIMTGKCISKAQLNADGKIQLDERWQWTCNDFSKGTSTLVEVQD